MEKIKYQTKQLRNALKKLKEAFTIDETEIVRDGTIQRFEFTFELSWKLLKEINRFHGLETNSPRESIKESYKIKIIENNKLWLETLDYRNIITHAYDEDLAIELYKNIKNFIPLFEDLLKKVEKIIKNDNV